MLDAAKAKWRLIYPLPKPATRRPPESAAGPPCVQSARGLGPAGASARRWRRPRPVNVVTSSSGVPGADPDRVDQGRHLRAACGGRRSRRDRRSRRCPGTPSPLASNASKRRKSPALAALGSNPALSANSASRFEPVAGARVEIEDGVAAVAQRGEDELVAAQAAAQRVLARAAEQEVVAAARRTAGRCRRRRRGSRGRRRHAGRRRRRRPTARRCRRCRSGSSSPAVPRDRCSRSRR